MNFLPAESADETLAAALEFVESFAELPLDPQPAVVAEKKRNALASKRLCAKKKQEVAALAEEAAVLEARLEHLQERATGAVTTGAVTMGAATARSGRHDRDAALVARTAAVVRASVAAISSRLGAASWFDVAIEEARERNKSEALNVELRRALEDLAKLTNSLRERLRGHAAGQSVASALEKFQQRYPERAIASPLDDLITDLQLQVVDQYFDIDTVFKPSAPDLGFSGMQASDNPAGQVVLELATTTSVASTLQDAVRMLTAGLSAKESHGQKTFVDKRTHGDEVEKRYAMDIQAAESLQGAVFMRSFDECDRFVVIWGGAATPTCAAVQVTLRHEGDAQASDARLTSQLVLNEWCLRAQMDLQFIHNVILEEGAKTMVAQV